MHRLSIIALGLCFTCLFSCGSKNLPVKKIAFIGRYQDPKGQSGSNEWYDTFVEKSLRAFLQEMNGKNQKVKFELVVFDIQQDPKKSDSVYQVIASDQDFIWVLDNSWGHDMAGASETIIKNRIPVLSINAYKGNTEYGPTTLFLIDYRQDINYISAFAKKVLKKDTVDFISENDVVFHDHFLESFDKFQLQPSDTITYRGQQNINQQDSVVLFNRLYQHFVEGNRLKDRVVIYNSHFMWGNSIVEFLNEHLSDSKFMSWSVPQREYIQHLQRGNQLILHHKSQFSVSEPVFLNYRELLSNDFEHFSWDGAASLMEDFYNAIDILDNFVQSTVNPKDITAGNMARYLEQIARQTTIGGNEILRFNQEGKLIREKTFTVYSQNGIFYYPYQLNNDLSIVPSLNLGIDLKSVYDLDFNSNSFKADFEFWLTGDSLHHDADKFVRIKNIRLDESNMELLDEKFANGQFLKHYSVAGKFSNSWFARSYPFDHQKLNVVIELLNPTDQLRITIDPATFDQRIGDLRINGWQSRDYYVTVGNNIYRDYLTQTKNYVKNEIIGIHFTSKRNFWSSILQIVLPLFFIGAIAIGILWVKNLSFSDLGEVIVGLFLAIVAFSISLATLTPKFDVLTKADQLFLLTFLYVFFIFTYLILLSSRWNKFFSPSVPWIRIALVISYPVLFFSIILLL